jgi:hypothetical protein
MRRTIDTTTAATTTDAAAINAAADAHHLRLKRKSERMLQISFC